MKLAYIIICHNNPSKIAAIVNRLTLGTENIAVLHVDSRADITEFKTALAGNDRAFFVDHRVPALWGSWNGNVAIINGLKTAIGFDCDRFIIYQADTWPLKTNEEINAFFESRPDVEYIRAVNATRAQRAGQYMKAWGYHVTNVDVRAWDNPGSIVHHFFSAINKLGIKYRRGYYVDDHGKRSDVFWGWIHVALTRKCVEYIIGKYEGDKGFNRYMMHVFPCDETYIPTVVFNSPFAPKTIMHGSEPDGTDVKYLTYFEYPPGSIRVFEHPEELKGKDVSECLFVRKVSEGFISEYSDGKC